MLETILWSIIQPSCCLHTKLVYNDDVINKTIYEKYWYVGYKTKISKFLTLIVVFLMLILSFTSGIRNLNTSVFQVKYRNGYMCYRRQRVMLYERHNITLSPWHIFFIFVPQSRNNYSNSCNQLFEWRKTVAVIKCDYWKLRRMIKDTST